MSTRAIAPVVGVTQRQVSTDVRSHFSPEPERIDFTTGTPGIHPLAPRPVAPHGTAIYAHGDSVGVGADVAPLGLVEKTLRRDDPCAVEVDA